MGFIASEAVAPLDYDFKPWANVAGPIEEPTTTQVANFWNEYVALVKRINAERDRNLKADEATTTKTDDEAPDETPEELDDRLRMEIVRGQHMSERTIHERNAILAKVCGGTPPDNDTASWSGGAPTFEDIEKLPSRLQIAFEAYLIKALSPEASAPATTS